MFQKHSKYFEGILQLRNPSKEILDYINKAEDASRKPMISQLKKVKNGFDVYFISNDTLMSFGRTLQQKFGGEMKTSARLHTRSRQTSKELYRVSVLLRLPFYNVGDVIEVKGEMYKVLLMGKKVFASNLETGKKVTFRYKELPE
ncbi:MAG TPA: NMD3-related protein [Candidatus Nanoarchaeia archaeon]|nr:NMD3-related protein [Candidatus Nanoarchaeia archaeon]